jgi:hypothetical protein
MTTVSVGGVVPSLLWNVTLSSESSLFALIRKPLVRGVEYIAATWLVTVKDVVAALDAVAAVPVAAGWGLQSKPASVHEVAARAAESVFPVDPPDMVRVSVAEVTEQPDGIVGSEKLTKVRRSFPESPKTRREVPVPKLLLGLSSSTYVSAVAVLILVPGQNDAAVVNVLAATGAESVNLARTLVPAQVTDMVVARSRTRLALNRSRSMIVRDRGAGAPTGEKPAR